MSRLCFPARQLGFPIDMIIIYNLQVTRVNSHLANVLIQGQFQTSAKRPHLLKQRTHTAVSRESYTRTTYTWDSSKVCD